MERGGSLETGQDERCRSATLFGPDGEARDSVPCKFDIVISDIPARAAQGQTTVLALEGQNRPPDARWASRPGKWHRVAAFGTRDASRSIVHLPQAPRCEPGGFERRRLLPRGPGQPGGACEWFHRRRRTTGHDRGVQNCQEESYHHAPGRSRVSDGERHPFAVRERCRAARLYYGDRCVVGLITLSTAIVERLDRDTA